ncbi:LysR family transcriptional regulator [Actinoplanes subtropicus]|uniref:LysR family transcriptional regulator n=1 Tax=Actinoplanes subtropicus TaxID=543632 RepID=UPI0006912652|nr:LysR family transcriptional regulator [Actinoplanes subtropicus]
MNLDLNHVQAFVTAADTLHFGRAAQQLHLTQQGLSHRITRLEQVLGERLFIRDGRGVELTAAGRRFLPHAQQLLGTAAAAIAATRRGRTPLRVDVWGQLHAPLRWIGRLPAIDRALPLDISMRRNAPAAVEALDRGEIDAAFCIPPRRSLPPGLSLALIGLDQLGAVVPPGHALAGRAAITARDLRGSTLWHPSTGSDPELIGLYRQLAARYELRSDESGSNLGLHHLLAGLADRPDRLVVLPLAIDPRCVPIVGPAPYNAWTMIWRTGNREEELALLRVALTRAAVADAPPEWDPATCWLPPSELAYLSSAQEDGHEVVEGLRLLVEHQMDAAFPDGALGAGDGTV